MVNSVALKEDKLLSASDDGTVRIWDVKTNKGVSLLRTQSREPVSKAVWAGDYVFSASDSALQLFDVRNPSLIVQQMPLVPP